MNGGDMIPLAVCVDCLQVAANGRDAGAEYAPGHSEAYAVAVAANGGEPVPAFDEERGHWFSWSPCQFCGSTLGGDRFDAVLVEGGRA